MDKNKIGEIIKKSHERSENYGVEKERIISKRIIKERELESNKEKNKEILKVADPFMTILYDFLKDSGFLIILTDREGCILDIIGDEDIVEEATKMEMVLGAYMDEKSIGTNAMGIAIKDDIPIQISAKEHFITAYHKWTCSAAPIHDSEGNIIGSLNLTGARDKVHPHTLGIVVAAVKSIENKVRADKANNKLIEAYEYMHTIVDSISSGIYSVGNDGIINNINLSACTILGIDREGMIGTSAQNILPNWKQIFRRLESGKTYVDMETALNDSSIKGRYNVSATPIKSNDSIIGMVIVFKELQKVYNLVNKYSGMVATYTFDDIIAESESMKNIIEYSKKVASSPSTVLILGESGTGKELLAQSIHNASDRCDKTFVAVNCGAIPKSLIESELFGYEEGAFTGAKRGGHSGKFELASGGTLFLDEIGEMPLDMQVNLLRVLQEGLVTRVGGDKVIPVDVRIIAATNKDLKMEVEKGTFRSDLYYRLRVIPITIPALRNRRDDLPILIKYFLKVKSAKLNKRIPVIESDLYNTMMNYNWPGNIRELENYIENIVNFNGTSTIKLGVPEQGYEIKTKIDNVEKNYNLETIEKGAIEECLTMYNNNLSKVSKALGISRTTLYAKMKKYEVNI